VFVLQLGADHLSAFQAHVINRQVAQISNVYLKANRAIGVVQVNQHNLQVVIGPQVQSVKDELVTLMRTVEA
jgi:PTS system maltose and glucose-specific IIC component